MTENNTQNSEHNNIQDKKFKKRKIVKNKTSKKISKRKGIHIGIGSITLVLFCSFLLVIATFLQLDISHFIIPAKLFSGEPCTISDYIYSFKYIPQIPIVLLVVGLLGRRFGLISILVYIATGLLFIPVFALGGGWRYIFEYGFGYILAYLPAAFILGTILKKGYSYKNIAMAVILSVITIHLIGIFYMSCLALVKHSGIEFISGWIAAQSGLKIFYDVLFSFLAVLFTKYARILLWIYF